MAKKKPGKPPQDLIDQLLDDVGDIAANPDLQDAAPPEISRVTANDAFMGQGQRNEEGGPIGLTPSDEKVLATKIAPTDGMWGDIAKDIDVGEGVPASEILSPSDLPSVPDQGYQGPSADHGYQSFDDLINQAPSSEEPEPHFQSAEGFENEATRPIQTAHDDATMSIANGGGGVAAGAGDYEATVAADGFANRRKPSAEPQEKVVIGSLRGHHRGGSGQVYTNMDASLAQAENLKIAQQRILELEKENDRLRQENEEVSSAAETIGSRIEELTAKVTTLESEKEEIRETGRSEIMILKGNLQFKESEVAKARLKIDELETRLRSDFKKIRVKERELENRLELARAEKAALIRAKDEHILELKRKIDQMQSEIDNYRDKLLELNKTIDSNQEQFKRTVRALRLALTNLEAKDENIIPLKKAE